MSVFKRIFNSNESRCPCGRFGKPGAHEGSCAWRDAKNRHPSNFSKQSTPAPPHNEVFADRKGTSSVSELHKKTISSMGKKPSQDIKEITATEMQPGDLIEVYNEDRNEQLIYISSKDNKDIRFDLYDFKHLEMPKVLNLEVKEVDVQKNEVVVFFEEGDAVLPKNHTLYVVEPEKCPACGQSVNAGFYLYHMCA